MFVVRLFIGYVTLSCLVVRGSHSRQDAARRAAVQHWRQSDPPALPDREVSPMPRPPAPRSLLALALLLAAALLPGATPALAQPGPVCDLAPVTLPLFAATPAAVIAATPATTGVAPEATDAAMRAAAERIVACVNDPSQAVRHAVFTDRYLASRFVGDDRADQPAFERMIATGMVPQEETWRLDGVSEIEPLPDGRVAVTLHLSSLTRTVADRLVLAWDADRQAWLIDDVLALDPPPATPTG
jgi:hypothetical protein